LNASRAPAARKGFVAPASGRHRGVLSQMGAGLKPGAATSRAPAPEGTMARKIFLCCVCGQPEDRCQCDRYCFLCHADYSVRLTEDGQYYCADCREACDYKTQDAV